MVAMKLTLVACLVLALLACTDPFSFEPGDPTKPNPPTPPQLVAPGDSWTSDKYSYPQDVDFGWQQVSGAQFYQIEVYRDSLLRSQYLSYSNGRVTQTSVTASLPYCGLYFWRVRAASRNWNDYTDWSSPFRFVLPNPAD
jgi:hypothetical protein